jgi:hypothetical protein
MLFARFGKVLYCSLVQSVYAGTENDRRQLQKGASTTWAPRFSKPTASTESRINQRCFWATKRMFISIFFAFAFCPHTKADDEGYWGTVLQDLAATYVVRLDDGRLLDAELNSGYDDWGSIKVRMGARWEVEMAGK